MAVTYILESIKNGRRYVGSTDDIQQRLKHHNSGANKSTKPYRPWKVIYTEDFDTKPDAFKREMQIKSYKGGRAFKELIS